MPARGILLSEDDWTEAEFLAAEHAGNKGWSDDPGCETFGLGTYIGGKIPVNDSLYGTVCFASREPREWAFTEMELTFVELLSRWLSYEFEQQNARKNSRRKNAQLEEFASVVSHDRRNPLSVAIGYLELAIETKTWNHLHG